ncbi:MAG: hypothetical protein PHE43_03860 [Candidatus Nanoarchaeia archaeon]|nr:hypothetical protein [Candidatus Nanoarchaeia archaeon]
METEVSKENLFEFLVEHHVKRNLPKCLKYFDPMVGRIKHPFKKNCYIPEKQENSIYKGVLIFADGNVFSSAATHKEEDVVNNQEIGSPKRVETKKDLEKYIIETEEDDGAHIFNGDEDTILWVGMLNNHPAIPPKDKALNDYFNNYSFGDRVPSNFVYSNKKEGKVKDTEVGNKTNIADFLSGFYSVKYQKSIESFQIKQSSYSDFGMGKVTHFTKDGLGEEFFFKTYESDMGNFYENADHSEEGVEYLKTSEGIEVLIDRERKIVGTYRQYEKGTDGLKLIDGAHIPEDKIKELTRACYHPSRVGSIEDNLEETPHSSLSISGGRIYRVGLPLGPMYEVDKDLAAAPNL